MRRGRKFAVGFGIVVFATVAVALMTYRGEIEQWLHLSRIRRNRSYLMEIIHLPEGTVERAAVRAFGRELELRGGGWPTISSGRRAELIAGETPIEDYFRFLESESNRRVSHDLSSQTLLDERFAIMESIEKYDSKLAILILFAHGYLVSFPDEQTVRVDADSSWMREPSD
ncbi:MAG: hypothetical protein AAF517_27445 [Planctomycetota bacterium]